MAFGTGERAPDHPNPNPNPNPNHGEHPTTQLCCEAVRAALERLELRGCDMLDMAAASVSVRIGVGHIDYGSGSGAPNPNPSLNPNPNPNPNPKLVAKTSARLATSVVARSVVMLRSANALPPPCGLYRPEPERWNGGVVPTWPACPAYVR